MFAAKMNESALTSVAQLVGGHPAKQKKGGWLESQTGHMTGLQVWSPVRACARAGVSNSFSQGVKSASWLPSKGQL